MERQQRFTIVPWRQIRRRCCELVGSVEMRPPQPNLQVLYMSGGNQQKVVLAKLLSARLRRADPG